MNQTTKENLRKYGIPALFIVIAVIAVFSASKVFTFAKNRAIMIFNPPDAVKVEVFEKTAIMVCDKTNRVESVSVTDEADIDQLRALLVGGKQIEQEPNCDFGEFRVLLRAEHYPSGVYSLCTTCPIVEYQVYSQSGNGYDYSYYELSSDANKQVVDIFNKYGLNASYAKSEPHGSKAEAEQAERNEQKKQ